MYSSKLCRSSNSHSGQQGRCDQLFSARTSPLCIDIYPALGLHLSVLMQPVANAIGYKWTVQVKRKRRSNGLQLYYTPPEVGAKRLRSWERVKQYASQQHRKSARTAVEQQAASAKTAAMKDSPTSPVGKLMVKLAERNCLQRCLVTTLAFGYGLDQSHDDFAQDRTR
jgi:hypothetical protein